MKSSVFLKNQLPDTGFFQSQRDKIKYSRLYRRHNGVFQCAEREKSEEGLSALHREPERVEPDIYDNGDYRLRYQNAPEVERALVVGETVDKGGDHRA